MNIDLLSFKGHLHIKEFLAEVECFFKYVKIQENKHINLVKFKLKGDHWYG